jgi:hypothetical protein
MISASDLLHIISEIHQYSMLLVELRDATTLGIWHSAADSILYFVFLGKLGHPGRAKLVEAMYSGAIPDLVKTLTLEDFIREIQGKKAKHIWLETAFGERQEHGFLSIAELKAFLRQRPTR